MSRTVLILSLFVVACGEVPSEAPTTSEAHDTSRSMVEAMPPAVEVAAEVAVTEEEPEPAMEEVVEVTTPPPSVDGGGHEVVIRPGESLVRLAGWTPMKAEEIAEYNGISVQGTLYPGEVLLLPLTEDEVVDLERSRSGYQDDRLERYLGKRGGLVGVDGHRVGTGETAWGIAREHGELPMWVVAAFNKELDLDRLSIGDTMHLPVLGDTVTLTSVDEPTEEEGTEPGDAIDPLVEGEPEAASTEL